MLIALRGHTYEVECVCPQAGIAGPAILIPADLRDPAARLLTELALDALEAFTSHYTAWVIDTGGYRRTREIGRGPYVGLLRVRTRLWPWYSTARRYGSWINGAALAIGLEALRRMTTPPRHVFVMHNDALPLRDGWLGYLHGKIPGCGAHDHTASECYRKVAGVKASQRNGAPHPSGALYDFGWLTGLGIDAMLPYLPDGYDAGEWPGKFDRHWISRWWTWRPDGSGVMSTGSTGTVPGTDAIPDWLKDTPVDLSFDDDGRAFYLHRGGGSWMSQTEARQWITLARQALGL